MKSIKTLVVAVLLLSLSSIFALNMRNQNAVKNRADAYYNHQYTNTYATDNYYERKNAKEGESFTYPETSYMVSAETKGWETFGGENAYESFTFPTKEAETGSVYGFPEGEYKKRNNIKRPNNKVSGNARTKTQVKGKQYEGGYDKYPESNFNQGGY